MRTKNNTTAYRIGLRQRILDVAMPMFKQRGVKAVKMDEIASKLTISKRTLYEIYENKETLLLEGIRRNHEAMDRYLESYAAKAGSEMEVLIEFLRVNMREVQNISSDYISDLNRYRSVIDYLRDSGNKHHEKSGEFIRRGIENGYFMPNLNYDLFITVNDAMLDYVMTARLYEKYPLKDIMHTIVSIFIRGCCTEKGRQLLDKVI